MWVNNNLLSNDNKSEFRTTKVVASIMTCQQGNKCVPSAIKYIFFKNVWYRYISIPRLYTHDDMNKCRYQDILLQSIMVFVSWKNQGWQQTNYVHYIFKMRKLIRAKNRVYGNFWLLLWWSGIPLCIEMETLSWVSYVSHLQGNM